MTDQEKEQLARRLSALSDVLNYQLDDAAALSLVESDPDKAQDLVRAYERGQEQQARLTRSRERLRAVTMP